MGNRSIQPARHARAVAAYRYSVPQSPAVEAFANVASYPDDASLTVVTKYLATSGHDIIM